MKTRFFGTNLPVIVTLILLLGAGMVMRTYNVDNFAYNIDERMELMTASGKDMAEVIDFSRYSVHPPLVQLLRHVWLDFFSVRDVSAQRSFALIPGLLLILTFYALGKELSGTSGGIIAAILVTCGYMFIVQSYIVRNYSHFLLFLSLYVYCGLLYARSHDKRLLLGALLAAICAILSHLSAVFLIAAFGIGMTIQQLLQRNKLKSQLGWIVIHLLMAAVWCSAYLYWQDATQPVNDYYQFILGEQPALSLNIIAFPAHALATILLGINEFSNNHAVTLLMLIPLIVGVIVNSRLLVPLSLIWFIGIYFDVTCLYPNADRHVLWVAPLLIPATAVTIARFLSPISFNTQCIIKLLCLVIVTLPYIPPDYLTSYRFTDFSEYTMPKSVHHALKHTLKELGSEDAIISGKTDLFSLLSLREPAYRHFNEGANHPLQQIANIPFKKSQIFVPLYPVRLYTPDILADTLQQLDKNQRFESIKQLVFVNTIWSSPPIMALMNCAELPKKIIRFHDPDAAAGVANDLITYVSLAVIVKDVMMHDVLPTDGRLHHCLAKSGG